MQLLILYHLVTAKAAMALGGEGPRAEAENGKANEAQAGSAGQAESVSAAEA
ncbi:MAG TPA: hypothetical protein VFD31_06290 [Thermoleophilaceae bacterium]|nr:hypothetical protein [Thermoleophilaceae bacterium]